LIDVDAADAIDCLLDSGHSLLRIAVSRTAVDYSGCTR
jgi:hypothetical protein